jgi:hypothetical protein
VVSAPVVAVARVGFRIDELEFLAWPDAQAQALQALVHDLRPADEDRLGEPFVHHDLGRAQDALVLALHVHHPPRRALRRAEERLHDEPGVVHEL